MNLKFLIIMREISSLTSRGSCTITRINLFVCRNIHLLQTVSIGEEYFQPAWGDFSDDHLSIWIRELD